MTVILNDNYETGDDSKWDGTSSSSGEIVEVTDIDPYEGTYHLRSYLDGGALGETAFLIKNINPVDGFYSQFRAKIVQENLAEENDRCYFLYLSSPTSAVSFVGLWIVSGTLRWRIGGADGALFVYAEGSSVPQTGVWYDVETEWYYHATEGYVRLFINGGLECEITGINTTWKGLITIINHGVRALYCDELEVYFDNFAARDVYREPIYQNQIETLGLTDRLNIVPRMTREAILVIANTITDMHLKDLTVAVHLMTQSMTVYLKKIYASIVGQLRTRRSQQQ